MTERDSRYTLSGPPHDAAAAPVVEADELYLGGERNEGSGLAGKTTVIVAAERRLQGSLGYVSMRVVDGFTLETVGQFKADNISQTTPLC